MDINYRVHFPDGIWPIKVQSIAIDFCFCINKVSRTIPHGETPVLLNQSLEFFGNGQVVLVNFAISNFFVIFGTLQDKKTSALFKIPLNEIIINKLFYVKFEQDVAVSLVLISSKNLSA
jgi:hypothetical protein